MEFLKMQIIQAIVPLIVRVVTDMITPEGVTEYRDRLIDLLRDITGKTVNEVDDRLIEVVISAVFISGQYQTHAAQIIDWVREYIMHSATSWDDMILLPLLNVLQGCFADLPPVVASLPVAEAA